MKILFLGGVFAKENEAEVVEKATAPVEFSAILFQQRLINGFRVLEQKMDAEVSVLSAPFIGAFPTASKIVSFKKFKNPQNEFTYVPFNNIWGIRNFSRTKSLKKAIKAFAEAESQQKLIVVYSAHTPFIKAAEYAKRIDKNIKICIYVTDLPQYMNLTDKRGFIYNTAKKYDISTMFKHMECADSYILLTEAMKEELPVGKKPYQVIEGIIDFPETAEIDEAKSENNEKYIVYTGKLDEKFGIGALLDSVKYYKDERAKLVFCGVGDCYEKVVSESKKDKRIIPLGQVSPQEAKKWREKASVLVNPRPDTEEYTKYSFPSKNIEYLLSGKPVVAYMLGGMPDIYKKYIFEISPSGNPAEEIAKAIEKALCDTEENAKERKKEFLSYAEKRISSESIANQIIKLNFK